MKLAPGLVERFAAAADIIREPEQLRTYECDGLTGRRVDSRTGRAPRVHERGSGGRAHLQRREHSVRRPWRGHGAVRRRAAGRGRDRDLARAHEPLPLGRPRPRRGRRRARRHESRCDPCGVRRRLLLRARPVVATGVHDRRQRRRELRRRALPEVRLHGQPRAGRRDRAAGRRAGRAVGVGRRPRSARRLRRLGGDARDRDETDPARPPLLRKQCGRCLPASSTPMPRAPPSPARSRRASCRPRSR